MNDNRDRRKIEAILREPLTRHRLNLNAKIRHAQHPENPQPFTFEDLRKFLDGIRHAGPEYKKEVLNIIEAV